MRETRFTGFSKAYHDCSRCGKTIDEHYFSVRLYADPNTYANQIQEYICRNCVRFEKERP